MLNDCKKSGRIMKEKLRLAFEPALGLLLIASVILGYYKDVSYMSEYCFLSGLTAGLVFIGSFVYRLKTKRSPSVWLYFCCAVNIGIILVVTLAMGLSLEGAFIFIHIVNPILLLAYWLVFCNYVDKQAPVLVLTDCVFPLCYIVFAFTLWKASGSCPFPANLILVGNAPWQVWAGIAGVIAAFILLGYLMYFINIFVHRRMQGEKTAPEN